MREAPPKQWRCRHCNERVDPTMAVCWNCGHDREGVAQPAWFVDRIDENRAVCVGCGYDLQGNTGATACPECGEPVPWEDCPVCGVRTSRAAMAEGCPACRAKEAGMVFEREVALRTYTQCPECQCDLRGSPTVTSCPECGAKIDRGAYETVYVPRIGQIRTSETLQREKRFWLSATGFTFLTGLMLLIAVPFLFANDWIVVARLAGLMLFACLVWLVISIIHLVANSMPSRD